MRESNRYPEGVIGEVSRLMVEKLSVRVHSAEEDLLAAGTRKPGPARRQTAL